MKQVQEEHFLIDGPVGKLAVTFSGPAIDASKTHEAKRLAIICHPHPLHGGTKDNKVVHTLARAYRDLGIASLRFNFRGVGQSEGVHDHAKGEVQDLEAVMEYALRHYSMGASLQFILAGFSFGSFVAAKLASQLDSPECLSRLLLVAPPVHHYEFDTLVLDGFLVDVIQGDQDEIVPFEEVNAWANLQSDKLAEKFKLKVINGATHFFHGRLVELKALVEV